jgi:hypothetical protein
MALSGAIRQRITASETKRYMALSVRGYTLREIFSDLKLRAKAEQYVFDRAAPGLPPCSVNLTALICSFNPQRVKKMNDNPFGTSLYV